ncbi:MAG TPA: methyltransferase domain-containing protein [Thermoanaerobaculia bacterium]|jgi:23S rRNA (guanine745-N1)-methyltransferase|nr:methyltransferase domain-containing protein [Thermoanaerobaculia bacterium]
MVTLLCPVRGCGEALLRGERAYACPRGHSFDVARSGYVNLLQPQDRRSPNAGDSREAVAARQRFLAAGHEAPFVRALLATVAALGLPAGPARPAVLDVGCGTGFHLGELAAALAVDAHGVDLSVPAVELAAKGHPEATFVVANADRFLPYAPGSFDLAMSLTARRNGPELRRVLGAQGVLLVAVPGADDLAELREAVLGERVLRDRGETTAEALAADFTLAERQTVRWSADLDAGAVRDALAATYRGARERERERAAALGGLAVTLSRDLLLFRPRTAL